MEKIMKGDNDLRSFYCEISTYWNISASLLKTFTPP